MNCLDQLMMQEVNDVRDLEEHRQVRRRVDKHRKPKMKVPLKSGANNEKVKEVALTDVGSRACLS